MVKVIQKSVNSGNKNDVVKNCLKMQISMLDTLHDYICYGDLITTGIATC